MTSSSIGIDIGGSFIKYGLVSSGGEILYSGDKLPTPSNGLDVVQTVERIVRKLLVHSPKNFGFPPVAIGISSCGVVDSSLGEVLESVAIPGYNGTNFFNALHDFGIPVHVENDARSAAWAEYCLRGDARDMALVTVGTGIGCAVITKGKIWRGSTFSAGELGHITIDLNGPVCSCGNIGCMELYVAQQAILDFVKHSIEAHNSAHSLKTTINLNGLDMRAISIAESHGDLLARHAFEHCGELLGVGITSLVNIFNPSVVLVGGGIIDASLTVLTSARQIIFARALLSARQGLVIEKARLGNQAGFVGAALLALHTQVENG